MLPHFFQKKETHKRDLFTYFYKGSEARWIDIVATERPYVFQQDSVPMHTSHTHIHLVQNWLSNNMEMFWSKEFWPPNSPNLNLMDYYVWSVIERVINKSRHSNVTSLQVAIEAAFANMDKDML